LEWLGKLVDDSHYDQVIEEDCRVLKADGSLLLHLRKNVLSKPNLSLAWSVIKNLNFKTTNRGLASGIKPQKRILQDGTISNTTSVPSRYGVTSFILGYFDRNPRFPYCRPCAWNQNHPEEFSKLLPMVQEVDRVFAETVPDRYAAQKVFADRTNGDFRIPGTVFTTLTINKNFRTACHKDAGDLAEGFGVITCIRQGRFRGGYLVLPDYRVAVKFDTADVLFFDVHEFHGNTAIHSVSEDFTRCTVVYYYRENMCHCLSAQEELERAKNRKAGDSLGSDHEED
jgi:2-oxoglutarate-Fe(II)-dependent dioxygenase family protein